MKTRAFTLVELLVVVAIIVVLIAILVPSMEGAVYQAQLAKCGAQLKSIAFGAHTYTLDNQGDYPYRPSVRKYTNSEAGRLCRNGDDDRVPMKGYIQPRIFMDPLATGPIDYEGYFPPSNGGTTVSVEGVVTVTSGAYAGYQAWIPYDLYFGFGFTTAGGGQMLKVNQRWAWADKEYAVLATDDDSIRVSQGFSRGAHPDSERKRVFWANQDANEITTRWSSQGIPGTERRGAVDTNTAFTDCSVQRYNKVTWDDERMARIAHYADGSPDVGSYWDHVPR